MLHGDPTNQNQLRSSQETHVDNQHDQHAQTSASIWKTFTAYSRAIKGSSVAAYEDSEAKTIAKERRQARLWAQSTEKNSVVFEMQASIYLVTFLQACYTCGSPDHLFRDCPKRATESVGDKRSRTDHIEPKVREVRHAGPVRTMRKNRREPITVGDFIRPAEPVEKPKIPTPVEVMDKVPSTNEMKQEAQHGPKASEQYTEDDSDSDYAPSESDRDSGGEKMYSENSDKDNMDLDKDEVSNLLREAGDLSGQSNPTPSL
ncbi:unnamed protein product [Rhizopus stolonifer]